MTSLLYACDWFIKGQSVFSQLCVSSCYILFFFTGVQLQSVPCSVLPGKECIALHDNRCDKSIVIMQWSWTVQNEYMYIYTVQLFILSVGSWRCVDLDKYFKLWKVLALPGTLWWYALKMFCFYDFLLFATRWCRLLVCAVKRLSLCEFEGSHRMCFVQCYD